MTNLGAYKKNGYNKNYIVISSNNDEQVYPVFATKKSAQKYCMNSNFDIKTYQILTFKQAVKKHPDKFCF